MPRYSDQRVGRDKKKPERELPEELPAVQSPHVKAILCSDLHFSHKAPVARSVEEDWYKVQGGYIDQINQLSEKHGDVPVVVAGDLFDRWSSPVFLTNFLIERIDGNWFTIPGQHDLPYHSMEEMGKTSYWNLVLANKITDITPEFPVTVNTNVRLWGFPWGVEITPLPKDARHDLMIEVAVCHHYVWKDEKHLNASKSDRVDKMRKNLEGYDVAVFGDNHKGFLHCEEGFFLFNGGTFMRRKSDERDYKPHVGLLYSDGSVGLHLLDTSRDKFVSDVCRDDSVRLCDFLPFLEKLESMTDGGINFEDALRRAMKDIGLPKPVRKIVLECLEKNNV